MLFYEKSDVTPEPLSDEEIRETLDGIKLHEYLHDNTTFWCSSSGQRMGDGDTMQILFEIRENPSLLKEWRGVHEEKHHVHFSFDGEAHAYPLEMKKYIMARCRSKLFSKSERKMRRALVDLILANTTFLHVGKGDVEHVKQRGATKIAKYIAVDYCKCKLWMEEHAGGDHVYCLVSSYYPLIDIDKDEDELYHIAPFSYNRKTFPEAWRRKNEYRYAKEFDPSVD